MSDVVKVAASGCSVLVAMLVVIEVGNLASLVARQWPENPVALGASVVLGGMSIGGGLALLVLLVALLIATF